MVQWMCNVHTCDHARCSHFHHPLWDTFVINFLLWFPLIQLIWPLMCHYLNIIVQLCYVYNTCGVFVHRFCLIYAIVDMWYAFSRQYNSNTCLYISKKNCYCLCRTFLLLGESWLAMILECKSTSWLNLPLVSTNATKKQEWCQTSY